MCISLYTIPKNLENYKFFDATFCLYTSVTSLAFLHSKALSWYKEHCMCFAWLCSPSQLASVHPSSFGPYFKALVLVTVTLYLTPLLKLPLKKALCSLPKIDTPFSNHQNLAIPQTKQVWAFHQTISVVSQAWPFPAHDLSLSIGAHAEGSGESGQLFVTQLRFW